MCHVRKKQRWVSFPAPSGLEVLSTPGIKPKHNRNYRDSDRLANQHRCPYMGWEGWSVAVYHCLPQLFVLHRMCPRNLWLWVSAAM